MKFTEYFIRHNVVSIILNAMILIIGLLCLRNIALREYPNVQIPLLTVRTMYPNANGPLIESQVTDILEDAIAGISGIKSIVSHSYQNISSIAVNFEEGSNMNNALIDLRDAITSSRAKLPKDIKEPQIIKGSRSSGTPFFALSISCPNMDMGSLTHYVTRYVRNSFRSVSGVASSDVWSEPYTMQITLDPHKLYNYGINVSNVIDALNKSNISPPVGKFRDLTPTTLDITLKSPKDFEEVYITTKNGKAIYLNSIAEIKLSTDSKQFRTKINGKPGITLAMEKNIDSNPINVAEALRNELENIKKTLPDGMEINVILDQSLFIKASINNIYSSIFEAVILVLFIVFLFLGDFRSTLIPLVTIPISLIGAVAIMESFGMSINTLTLLAMVLAIGLVVDDAIVVLENITRHMELGLSPLEASIKGSSEIGFAIVAMTCTLASVYIPIIFIKGMIGQLFIEFAVALAGSVIISGFVALTLSPMMCSKILKLKTNESETKIHKFLSILDLKYKTILSCLFDRPKIISLIMVFSVLVSFGISQLITKEVAPKEDRGIMGIHISSIPGKNMDDLEAYSAKAEALVSTIPEKQEYLTFLGNWGASTVVPLLPHDQRKRSQSQIINSIEGKAKEIPSVDAWPWGWWSGLPGMEDVMEGGNVSMAVSTTGDYEELSKYADKMLAEMNATNKFLYTKHDVKFDTAEFDVVFDKKRMADMEIAPTLVGDAMSVFFSSNQNLLFSKDDILYAITIDGKAMPWSLNEIYVINSHNHKIPIGTFASLKEKASLGTLPHYNQMRTATITGALYPNSTIESAMTIMEKIANDVLPKSFKRDWIGAAEITTDTSSTMILIFSMAIIFIYSILAIQFNNFFDPIVIMITVPLACSGALFACWASGGSLNIYTQIGLVTLVGLITKHGILIVEFANQLVEQKSYSIQEAVTHSAILRIRPILMTTGAMILGSLPLVFSSGAGSEARSAIGVILVGGLSFGTIFTLFVLPQVYCWIKNRVS